MKLTINENSGITREGCVALEFLKEGYQAPCSFLVPVEWLYSVLDGDPMRIGFGVKIEPIVDLN